MHKHSIKDISDEDLLSYVQYPAVYEEFYEARQNYGDLSKLDTRTFVSGMKIGQEIAVEIEVGKILFIKLQGISNPDSSGIRQIVFELNGQQRIIKIKDNAVGSSKLQRVKANPSKAGSIGAPMPGVVIGVKVEKGQKVKKGEQLIVLSAMKMETSVNAPASGIITTLTVSEGDNVLGGDLLVEIE